MRYARLGLSHGAYSVTVHALKQAQQPPDVVAEVPIVVMLLRELHHALAPLRFRTTERVRVSSASDTPSVLGRPSALLSSCIAFCTN